MNPDPEVADLLEFVLERCGHEPSGGDEPAVCETCAAVIILLEGRIRQRRLETEIMH